MIAAGVTITHPERVISETGHITKGELAEYHAVRAEQSGGRYVMDRIRRAGAGVSSDEP